MEAVKKFVDKISEILSIVIFFTLVALVTYQVVVRYFFSNPSAWSEQLSRYLFVWLVLINAAYIFGKREHMNINYFLGKFPPVIQLGITVLTEFMVLVFMLGVFVFGGITAVKLAIPQMDSAMPISMGIIYLALPISGVLTTFYSLNNIINLIKKGTHTEKI